jgi:hypothetical protein
MRDPRNGTGAFMNPVVRWGRPTNVFRQGEPEKPGAGCDPAFETIR